MGDSEHSVAHQIEECERHVAAGGMAVGAFDGDRLVAIGIVVPHVRPGIAQLAFLHVSNRYRGAGVGRRLNDMLEQVAREAGDTTMVVSATPSENTVRFYRGRGYEPTASPLPELVELEPEDIHFEKRLGPWKSPLSRAFSEDKSAATYSPGRLPSEYHRPWRA